MRNTALFMPTRRLAIGAAVVLLGVTGLCGAIAADVLHGHSAPSRTVPTFGPSRSLTVAVPSKPASSRADAAPATSGRPPLPATASPDVYAAAAAREMWTIDYRLTGRDETVSFWRRELATTVPQGVPIGTTLASAQDAAMATVESYLPAAASWSNLAASGTTSSFTVTSVAEPPSWIQSVSTGHILDPGLTARVVTGVQKLVYGSPAARHTVTQPQLMLIAMLCPPTTDSCRVEILPPLSQAIRSQ